jgi:ElaB/YqjD/DUF883 family membrane-anchored ribosome-binding protein
VDIKAEKEELTSTVDDAVTSIRSELDEFARFVAQKKDEIADILKAAGGRTGDQLNGIAREMRVSGDHGVATVARTVADNPLTAVALAAATGMLIGMMSRQGR